MRPHRSIGSVRYLWRLAIIAMIMLLCRPIAIYPQGFGVFKKDVHFYRLRLPKLFVHNFDIALRVDATTPLRDFSASEFKRTLEQELTSGEPRINLYSPQPQIVIDCQLNGLTRTETWTKKSEYERQKVGEKEELNKKTQKMEKKDVYKDVKVENRYRTVTWSASIAFRITETNSLTTLASDRNTYSESKEFKEKDYVSKPDLNLQGWANLTAKEIAAYVVPTREQVRILLPKGKLDSISDKIEDRKLAEALQELEDMPSLKKPEDEAYKFYILGACYEVMAYTNDQTDLLNQYLEQSAKNYAKALDIKPDEKYFREAQHRLQSSVAIYKELRERYYAAQKTPNESRPKESLARPSPTSLSVTEFKPTASPSPPSPVKTEPKRGTEPPSKSQSETKATDPLTNETIVRLVKAKLSEENIIATINEAPATSFDLSPNAQLQLLQAGVTNPVISAMRQAADRKKVGDAPAAPAAAVNVSGVWHVTVKMPSGTINPILVLKQEGEKLTGTYKASERDLPLIGTIRGNEILFSYYANYPKQEFEVKFAGKLEGQNSMKGKATLGKIGEAPWMAKKQ
jgi:hypothetical protein